jgi:hypothetical protein
MVISLFSILVALFLGFGAAKEFFVRGVQGGEVQPFLIGLAGMIVSLLLVISGIALWRQWPVARRLVLLAGVSSIVFHVYAALPPHRYVGILVLLVGAGYGMLLLFVALSSRRLKEQGVSS